MSSDGESQSKYILSLDVGTTVTRCFIYGKSANVIGKSRCHTEILYPEKQGVEINPDTLWKQVLKVIKDAIRDASIKPTTIASIGISTQRGTFMLWDKDTGKPYHDFIVWQDTRSESISAEWNASYWMKSIQTISKLLHTITQRNRFLAAAVLRFRPHHVSMRLLWIFQKFPKLKSLCEQGKVCFGTIDTWLVWKLTSGRQFVSEYSCASSTGLYDPYIFDWSSFICGVLGIPTKIFPPVLDTNAYFGECDAKFFGAPVPICALVGDQQAAMYGQCCFSPGDLKLTIGTGAFLDLNVGTNAHASVAGFYPLIGWKIGSRVVHLAEGSSNTAGNAVEWLKNMKFITEPKESESIAKQTECSEGIYFVPSFNGIQAPVNDSQACGCIMGITQSTRPCHIVRAVLESLAFRNKQLFESLEAETNLIIQRFVCDGGVSGNSLVVQLSADLIGRDITVPIYSDMSALGAAFLAGLAVGYWKNEDELKDIVLSKRTFVADKGEASKYRPMLQCWRKATERSLYWYEKV